MSTKQRRYRYFQRRLHVHTAHVRRSEKRPNLYSNDQVTTNLIQQFNFWCNNLRTQATYEFDQDDSGHHRCKITLPIFPNLQSIGHGSTNKKDAKRHAIVKFFAQMEKRKQMGLFVPNLVPPILRSIQAELRRTDVPIADLNQSIDEYLLAERNLSKNQARKKEKMMKIIERVCNVRIITLWSMTNAALIYVVGAKTKQEIIGPYLKALFQPETELMFNYGEKLFDVFNDQTFLDGICQRLKVLCNNNQIEKCKLFILGSVVNAQCCYNEFVVLRREFEKEAQQRMEHFLPKKTKIVQTGWCELVTTVDQSESTRSDCDENETDQLPDYSIYDDNVNASILRVLQDEEEEEELTKKETTVKKETVATIKTTSQLPAVIELSDDSDQEDLKVLGTVKPKNPIQNNPLPQSQNVPQPSMPQPLLSNLRHIVLDGQNVARNSNDYNGSFSWLRLYNAIQFFKKRAHENIIAFLPLYVRDTICKRASAVEAEMERKARDEMINARLIAFTPSRYNNGHRLTNYDDRFILQYAADNDGIVVSNDNFRDLQHEPNFQFVINNRILPFATINETFMPATDPLGRNGPNLDAFLSKNPLPSTLAAPLASNRNLYHHHHHQHHHQSNFRQHYNTNHPLPHLMQTNIRPPFHPALPPPSVYYSS